MGAANGRLYQKTIRFTGRAINGAFITHGRKMEPPPYPLGDKNFLFRTRTMQNSALCVKDKASP